MICVSRLVVVGLVLSMALPAWAQGRAAAGGGPMAGRPGPAGARPGPGLAPGRQGRRGPMADGAPCDPDTCPFMHEGQGGRPGMGLHMLERAIDQLGLSEAARKKVKDAIYDAAKQGIALGAELAQARLDLGRLLEADKPDADAALKQADKIGQLQTELIKLRVRTLLKIQTLLSAEQRKKLRQLRPGPGFW